MFTDIEGSTRRWERYRPAMGEAVARHDRLVRAAIERHNGFVFKTIGDAFCAAFRSAPEALAASVSVQQSIVAEDWDAVGGLSIRIAVHAGDAEERADDYFGPTVNRVARLLSIGHGGQILMSGIVADLARGSLPATTSLMDLGEHTLKDILQSERVFQLRVPGLRESFPHLRSVRARPNNLPPNLTTFVGREREVAEIHASMRESRVVSILGTGGIGKSRVSLRAAELLLEAYDDGIWFVELAPISGGELVAATIAKTLGYDLDPRQSPLDALIQQLPSKRMMLVLDNCEHVVKGTAEAVSAIVRTCPHIVVLATSREPLGVAGETAYRLAPLAFPPPGPPSSAADALAFDAVSLFVKRASAADATFVLTDRAAPIVADICRRLDGIPLAIELAAPRVKLLGLKQLRDRLDDRFKVLTGGSRDALPRQQTLRALIDWSFELLTEGERRLLRRIGVFVGGFSLEAMTAVFDEPAADEWASIETLASLADKSLVLADRNDVRVRFGLYESTREYAIEKLEESGERAIYAERHARWCTALVSATYRDAQQTFASEVWYPVFEEIDNVRAAIAWSRDRETELAAKIAGSVPWHELGAPLEGLHLIEWLEPRLEMAAPEVSAAALLSAAVCAEALSRRTDSRRLAERGLALARASGSRFLIASCLLFTLMPILDDPASIPIGQVDERLAELRTVAAGVDSQRLQQAIDTFEFVFAGRFGRVDRARELMQPMLARVKKGSGRAFLALRMNLAEFEHSVGATDHAIELVEDAKREIGASRDRELASGLLANLAGYYCASRDLARARQNIVLALKVFANSGPATLVTYFALEHFALVLALGDECDAAARCAAFCDDAIRSLGAARGFTESRTFATLKAILDGAFDDARYAELSAEGCAMTLQAHVDLALRHGDPT